MVYLSDAGLPRLSWKRGRYTDVVVMLVVVGGGGGSNSSSSISYISPTYILSQLAQGTLYTHFVMSSLSCLSLGCTSNSFHVFRGFMAIGTLFLHNSYYGFRNFLYIWYNDHRPFHRSFLFFIRIL